jgi:hypothetical protein
MLWRLHSGLGSPFPNGDTLLQYVGDVIILPGAPCPMWETSERVCGKGAAFQGGCAVRDDSQALVPLWSMRFKASSLFAGCAGWLTQPEGCCGLELVAAYTQPAMGFVPERCCTRAFWSANPVAGFAAAACLGRNYFVDASQGFPILDLWVEPYIP